jgi:hypothetical protein
MNVSMLQRTLSRMGICGAMSILRNLMFPEYLENIILVFPLSTNVPDYTLLSCNIQEITFSILNYPFIMNTLSLIILVFSISYG